MAWNQPETTRLASAKKFAPSIITSARKTSYEKIFICHPRRKLYLNGLRTGGLSPFSIARIIWTEL
ncbi:MAG: hypothetical protein OP8BY_2247 [Candidatus Saccharicenans subterraneus]|uniref:Uncharacterized protein n=1 Tax=Candidatus Saccharicenans subterraneus TaxID=2508984 RepID=A0A3E2BM61_9BACT|nr:MAG: hypothetical protein OP8BY_2247 [Candidatus Saccharicenans subterraneum]